MYMNNIDSVFLFNVDIEMDFVLGTVDVFPRASKSAKVFLSSSLKMDCGEAS